MGLGPYEPLPPGQDERRRLQGLAKYEGLSGYIYGLFLTLAVLLLAVLKRGDPPRVSTRLR